MAKLINKYSSQENKIPVATGMSAGEIAVNFHDGKEFLSIKNSASEISTFDRTTTYGKSGATKVNYDSLRLKGSSSAADSLEKGTNSATLGQELQTENAGEVAVGRYNKSTQGQTVFSVGAGTGAGASRSNVFEVTTGKVIADSIETREGIAYATMDIVEDNEYVTAQALNLLNSNINDLSAMTEDFVTKTDYATDVNAGIVRVGGSGLTMSAGKAVANVDGTTIQINGDGKLVAIGGGGGGSVTAGSGITVNGGTVAVNPDTSVGFGFNGSSALTLSSVTVSGDITTTGTVKGGTVSGATVNGDNGQFTSLTASSISDGNSHSYVKTNSYASSSTAGVVKIGEGLSVSNGVISVSGIPSTATSENINASGNVTVTGANSRIIADGANAVICGTSVHGGTISGTTVKGDTVSGTNGNITSLTASTIVNENNKPYLTSENLPLNLPLATSENAGVVKVSGGSGLEMVSGSNTGITDQLKVKVDETTIQINSEGKLVAIGGGGGGSFTGGTVPGATTFTNTLEVGKTIGKDVSGLTFEPSTGYVSVKIDTDHGIQEAMVFSSFTGTNYPTVFIPKYDAGGGDFGPTLYASRTNSDPYVYASMIQTGFNYDARFNKKTTLSLTYPEPSTGETPTTQNTLSVALTTGGTTDVGYPEFKVYAGTDNIALDIYSANTSTGGVIGTTKLRNKNVTINVEGGRGKDDAAFNLDIMSQTGSTSTAVTTINAIKVYDNNTAQNVDAEFTMSLMEETLFLHKNVISADTTSFAIGAPGRADTVTIRCTSNTADTNTEGTITLQNNAGAASTVGIYSSTGYSSSSDARLKHNIEDITNENLDKIKNVKLKQYAFNGYEDIRFGAIAQDVESAGITSLLSEDANGYKILITQDLLVLKIAYLERELERLTEKIERLEERA